MLSAFANACQPSLHRLKRMSVSFMDKVSVVKIWINIYYTNYYQDLGTLIYVGNRFDSE